MATERRGDLTLPVCENPISLTAVNMSCWSNSGSRLLHGVTADFPTGEIVAVMGPSGAGKTTALNAMAGRFNGIQKGEMFVNGNPVSEPTTRDYFAKHSGYMLQLAEAFVPELTVMENVVYAALLRLQGMPMNQLFARAEEVIALVGLSSRANVRVGDSAGGGISGGQKRKLMLAIELLARPPVLFLDEPTSGLDSTSSLQVMEVLRTYSRSQRLVVVTIHQPRSEIFKAFDKLLLLYSGEVAYLGAPLAAIKFLVGVAKQMGAHTDFSQVANPADIVLDILNHEAHSDGSLRGATTKREKAARAHEAKLRREGIAQHLDLVSQGEAVMADAGIDSKNVGEFACEMYRRLAARQAVDAQQRVVALLPGRSGKLLGRMTFSWPGRQLLATTWVIHSRDLLRTSWTTYWIPTNTLVVATVCAGSMFFEAQSTFTLASVLYLSNSMLIVAGIPGVCNMFASAFDTYKWERAAGVVGPLAFLLRAFVNWCIIHVLSALIVVPAIYALTFASFEAERFCYMLVVTFSYVYQSVGLICLCCCAMVGLAGVGDAQSIITPSCMIINLGMCFNGLFQSYAATPAYWKWALLSLSPIYWCLSAMLRVGLEGYRIKDACAGRKGLGSIEDHTQSLADRFACEGMATGNTFLQQYEYEDVDVAMHCVVLLGWGAACVVLALFCLSLHGGAHSFGAHLRVAIATRWQKVNLEVSDLPGHLVSGLADASIMMNGVHHTGAHVRSAGKAILTAGESICDDLRAAACVGSQQQFPVPTGTPQWLQDFLPSADPSSATKGGADSDSTHAAMKV